jgi:xylulokinase
MSLMGIDVGTTGCKAVAFDERGRVLASAYREYPLVQPHEDWVELEPELIWRCVKETLREAGSALVQDPVTAIGVSSQGETVTAVDASGKCLYNFIVTFDNRTIEQVRFWEATLGKEAVYRITGMPLHPMYSINKILWIRSHLPDVFNKAVKFPLVQDFVISRLCGEYAIDFTLAARSMAFDVRALRWSPEILAAVGVEEDRLSRAVPSGTIVGRLRKGLQQELELPDVPIVTGGHDQPCGALGAGITGSGTAMNATGTVDAICPVFSGLQFSPKMLADNYAVYPYAIQGLYCTIGFNLTGGLLLKWYRDTLCQEEERAAKARGRSVYDEILGGMAASPKDLFVLPHFVGSGTPHLDPLSKGAIVGLRVSTSKADLTRSILDSIALEMKLNIERLRSNGIPITAIHAVGGGAKSDRWLRLKASCFGMPIRRPRTQEAVSLGAAVLAGWATHRFSDVRQGAEAMIALSDTFEPDPTLVRVYEDKYAKYRELYPVLSGFNKRLDAEDA